MSEEEQIILPERFKRVGYIESTGTQYINTELIPDATYGFYADVQSLGGSGYLAGTQNTGGQPGFWLRVLNNIIGVSYYSNAIINCSNSANAYKRIIVENNFLNNRKLIVNNSDVVATYSDTFTYQWNYNFTIFRATYQSNTNFDPTRPIRVFRWKMSIGQEIVKDFVPVFDTLRSEACLYEVIEGKAYYNEGSGDFLYGLKDEQLGIFHKLPEGFKRVKYLIANGSQYIDTNYVPTNETGYYLEGQGYTTSETYYFGLRENTSTNSRICACATPNVVCGWMTFVTLTTAAAYLRQETVFAHNFLNSRISKATINETDFTYNLPELDFAPTFNIRLFGYNKAGSPDTTYNLKGRIDIFLISEGDQIVRQFIPCLDTDGIPCMYELYTGTVHYNQGSGQFSYPREYTNDPINLPAGYTKCVYLQSNGTQWIDTEVIPNADTGVYLKAQHLSYGDFIPFGSWENSSAYYYPPRFNTNNKSGTYSFGTTYQLSFYYDKGDDLIYTSTMNLYNDRTVNFWSEDTNWFGIIPVNFTATFTRPLWLFSYNMDNTSINSTYAKFSGRIFRAKITQGTSLIHDYVPCLDDSGRPCMYDLIDNVPLYNQSGGAEFAYCLEHQLPSDFLKLKYLESTGTQIIKTGIIPTDSTGIYVDAYHVKQDGNTVGSVIGLRNTNGNTYFYVGRVQRDTNGAGFGWGAFTTPGGTGNVRYEASLNFLNNRQSIITAPSFAQRINALGTLSFTPTKDLYMFGMNNYDGAATLYSTYRIYRAKISEGSEIVRDWVPSYDTRRGKPCMYDLINNVAYYNDGEGEFLTNRDFEGTYTGYGIMGGIGNRLGYSNISIDNSSFNFITLKDFDSINTGLPFILIDGDNGGVACVEIDFEIISIPPPEESPMTIIGPMSSIDDPYMGIILTSDRFWINKKDRSYRIYDFSVEPLGRHKIKANFNNEDIEYNIYYNDEKILLNENTGSGLIADDSGGNITIGGSWTGAEMRVYEVNLYNSNNELISNLKPHEEDGVQGLYCSIRNVFLPIETL